MLVIYYNSIVFEEIAHRVQALLAEENIPTALTQHLHPNVATDKTNIYIMFGLHDLVALPMESPLPSRYIAYQFEQVPSATGHKIASPAFTATYLERLAQALWVWDYSLRNIQRLRNDWLKASPARERLVYVPLGPIVTLPPSTPPSPSQKTVDILFFGLPNRRRETLINAIREAHPTWRIQWHQSALWGDNRTQKVAASHIVLNLHYYDPAILEVTRLVPLLEAHACVISESSDDPLLDRDYADQVTFFPAGDSAELIRCCEEQLANPRQYSTLPPPFARRFPFATIRQLLSQNSSAAHASDESSQDPPIQYDAYQEVPHEITAEGYRLLLPPLSADNLVPVTIITPTYRRGPLFKLAVRNWQLFDYPPQLLEWIVLDDTETQYEEDSAAQWMTSLQRDTRVHYHRLPKRLPVWEKRNLLVQMARHPVIVHMDDDDYHWPTGIATKVRTLGLAGIECVGSADLGVYRLRERQSYLLSTRLMPEAGMAYWRRFWEERPFQAAQLRQGEAAAFLQGREQKVMTLPYAGNLLVLDHGQNTVMRSTPHVDSASPSASTDLLTLLDFESQLFLIGLRKGLCAHTH